MRLLDGEIMVCSANPDKDPDAPQTLVDGKMGGKTAKIVRNSAKTGEPIFVVTAHDLLSVFSIQAYIKAVEDYLPSDMSMQGEVVEALNEVRRWQHSHPDRVRFPD
jgi:hypothetical protein